MQAFASVQCVQFCTAEAGSFLATDRNEKIVTHDKTTEKLNIQRILRCYIYKRDNTPTKYIYAYMQISLDIIINEKIDFFSRGMELRMERNLSNIVFIHNDRFRLKWHRHTCM